MGWANSRHLIVPAIGLGAGAASSFLGIGGGTIIVPFLMLGLGVPFKEAVGTSLATVVLFASVGIVSALAVDANTVAWTVAAALSRARSPGRGSVAERWRECRSGCCAWASPAFWSWPVGDCHGADT